MTELDKSKNKSGQTQAVGTEQGQAEAKAGRNKPDLRELVTYFFTGVATTLVNWGCYALFVRLLPEKPELFGVAFNVTVSNVIAWVVAVIFAFVTNKIWVFRSCSWKPKFVMREAALFVSARLLTGVLEMVGVPLLVGLGMDQPLLGAPGMWAKVAVSVIVMVLNYIFSKLIVFRK